MSVPKWLGVIISANHWLIGSRWRGVIEHVSIDNSFIGCTKELLMVMANQLCLARVKVVVVKNVNINNKIGKR